MKITIEQMDALGQRLIRKTVPDKWRSNEALWRMEKIKHRLVKMEREQRMKEGRYWNGK